MSPEDIRAYLLGHHYRTAFEWSAAAMARAAERARYWRGALGGQAQQLKEPALDPASHAEAFHAAMQDDLDTPTALNALDRLAKDIVGAKEAGRDVTAAQRTLRALGSPLGLTFQAMSDEQGSQS